MNREQFHSFIKLVRLMYNKQQDSYKAHNGNKNLVAQAKALETKVAGKLRDVQAAQSFYTWQPRFIVVVKEMRAEQEMYYASKHDTVLQRCKQKEATVGTAIAYIETHFPQVFAEISKQAELL